MNLSYAMYCALGIHSNCNGNTIGSNTYYALERRGLWCVGKGITEDGVKFVEQCLNEIQSIRYQDFPVPVIRSDDELLSIVNKQDDVAIYVYRGNMPLVVQNGDGQNPLAILSLFYAWEIQEKRAGKFLSGLAIIGHKGSYGYQFKNFSEDG